MRPLIPDSQATICLRQACRARQDLVRHRVAVGNQLRAHLLGAFPGAVGLFCELHSVISLAFLARFGRQDRADWLSEKRLASWLKGASYSGRTSPAELYHRKATTFSGNNLLVFCCVCRLRGDTGDQLPQGGHLIRCHRGSRP